MADYAFGSNPPYALTGTAMVKNLQNKRFPRINRNCDYVQFPSLLP